MWKRNLLLLAAVIALAIGPLVYHGSGRRVFRVGWQAEALITQTHPGLWPGRRRSGAAEQRDRVPVCAAGGDSRRVPVIISPAGAVSPKRPAKRRTVRLIDRNAQTNRWRRIAAIEKVTLSLGMIILALLSPSWTVQGLIIATMLALTSIGAGVPPRDMLVSASVHGGLHPGQRPGADLGGAGRSLHAANRHLHGGDRVGLLHSRSLAGVSALLFLALTTPLTDILRLLRRAGLSAEVSDIALMMFRFTPG